MLVCLLLAAAVLGHKRSSSRARARKLARLNGVKVRPCATSTFCWMYIIYHRECNWLFQVLPDPVLPQTDPEGSVGQNMVQHGGVRHEEVMNKYNIQNTLYHKTTTFATPVPPGQGEGLERLTPPSSGLGSSGEERGSEEGGEGRLVRRRSLGGAGESRRRGSGGDGGLYATVGRRAGRRSREEEEELYASIRVRRKDYEDVEERGERRRREVESITSSDTSTTSPTEASSRPRPIMSR